MLSILSMVGIVERKKKERMKKIGCEYSMKKKVRQ